MDENKEIKETPATETAPAQQAGETKDSKRKPSRNKWGVIGILLSLAAWVLLAYRGDMAIIAALVSLACGIAGLKAQSQTCRNAALTALVASGVLTLVLGAFMAVVYVGLKAL